MANLYKDMHPEWQNKFLQVTSQIEEVEQKWKLLTQSPDMKNFPIYSTAQQIVLHLQGAQEARVVELCMNRNIPMPANTISLQELNKRKKVFETVHLKMKERLAKINHMVAQAEDNQNYTDAEGKCVQFQFMDSEDKERHLKNLYEEVITVSSTIGMMKGEFAEFLKRDIVDLFDFYGQVGILIENLMSLYHHRMELQAEAIAIKDAQVMSPSDMHGSPPKRGRDRHDLPGAKRRSPRSGSSGAGPWP